MAHPTPCRTPPHRALPISSFPEGSETLRSPQPMTSSYVSPLADGSSIASEPSPRPLMYSDLMDRVLDGVLDSLLADRQVAFRYLLLRHRSHSDLSVAVSIDEEDYSLRELRPVHRWPRLMAVDGSRRSLGELCIKFDTSTGAWSLGRHLPADKTYSPNRITSVSATTSQAAQCDCAEINPWGRSWKLLIQFPGNQEGTMLVHHWADMSEVVKKMGYTLMKVYPDGALRRVDDEDKVPSDLRFLWLAGRPAVVKDGYEQKGLPRTLNLGDVEVVEWVKPLDTGARDGYEDMGGSVSETTSGRSTPESRDDVVESFDDKTRQHAFHEESEELGLKSYPRNGSNPLAHSRKDLVDGGISRQVNVTQTKKLEPGQTSTRHCNLESFHRHAIIHPPSPSKAHHFRENDTDEWMNLKDLEMQGDDDDDQDEEETDGKVQHPSLEENSKGLMIRADTAVKASPGYSFGPRCPPRSLLTAHFRTPNIPSTHLPRPSSSIHSPPNNDTSEPSPSSPLFTHSNIRIGLPLSSPLPSDYIPSPSSISSSYYDHLGPHLSSTFNFPSIPSSSANTHSYNPLRNPPPAGNHDKEWLKFHNALDEEQHWRNRVGPFSEWSLFPPVQISAEFLPESLRYYDWGSEPRRGLLNKKKRGRVTSGA